MRRVILTALFGFALLSTGCVSKAQNDGVSTYSYAWWAIAIAFVGLLIVTYGGFAGRTSPDVKNKLLSWFACLAGIVSMIVFMPDLVMDKVIVDKDGFKGATGFWFSPRAYDCRFNETRELGIETKEGRGRRGRKTTSTYVKFTTMKGQAEEISAGVLLKEAIPEIEEKAGAAGFNAEGKK